MERAELRNRLHELLFDQVPCRIAVLDRDRNIVEHNTRFAEVFGEGRGHPCFQVYKNRTTPCPQCVADETFRDGQVRVNEEAGVDHRGRPTHYVVHTAPVRDEDGRIVYVLEMSTDVTEVKRLRREYDILFEKVPCYVAVLNRDLRIVRANTYLRETFGEPAGRHCWEVLKRRGEKCGDCPAEKVFRDGKTHGSPQVGISRDGLETHYVVGASPLPGRDGEISHIVEIALDVTEMRRLEQDKLEAERSAAVGRTVAGLAHGIKNILTGLEGGMYVVGSGLRKGRKKEIDQGWEMLERNIGRISDLVKSLLAFSKGRAARTQLVAPGKLVKEVVELYKEAAARNGVTLRADVREDLAPAPPVPDDLRTCLDNLVSNALDACRAAGRPSGLVVVSCRGDDRAVLFEVADEGCGMDNEVKQKVFTNFFSTKGAGGTGLGLLLTRKIVREHGGKITVESTVGKGTGFRMTFPRDRLPPPRTDKEDAAD